MAIRLTPELLSDLKRAEAEGSACLMKFGATPAGHVIKIGDDDFKFNSAREDVGLCDIFEEQRRGEDGNGILKEAGSVWRKLSVLRTLNASEKDRVKKRSVEAQQQQKSRTSIILDPTHSQNLNQTSSIAGDAMGRRPPLKTKVQPPRKKFKPASPVRSPVPAPVPVQKPVVSTASVIASAKAAKAASVASPELPPSGRAASLPPPPPNGKPGAEEGTTPSISNVQMDNTPSPATTTPDTAGPAKPGAVVSPSELRNCLITLLTENPKGMTLKAVEKALGDSMPHVKPEKKTIEKAIRAIASYHAPGKYILKEGMTFAKPSPNSGSSPDNAAADSPPLVDSPALPDMNVDGSTHDQMPGGSRRSESGLLGDKPGSLHSSAAGKASSIVQKSSESPMSRAIRKANENYQKSQPQSQPDHIRPPPAASAQKPESRVTKDDVEVDIDDVDVGGDESREIEIIEGEGRPDLNGDTEVESVPDSPKEKALPAHSGGSESSSSSGSSDSDSESSDSGDSRSGTSGSGSDSDSDGSSSDSDDDNMDEDVEIVSDDEDEDAGHQKPKANDKKKTSHQSKDAKRAKLKPPEKLQAQESEEIDIGGDEGSGQPVVDPEERATVVVENLDVIDDEVDVVSVGDGDSPHELGSVSPERQTEESKRDIAGAQADVEDNRDLLQKSTAKGNNSSLSKEEPAKTGEVGAQKDGKPTDAERPKAGAPKGRINSMANNRMLAKHKSPSASSKIATKESPVHTNNRLPARDSAAQTSSPSRPESGAKSLLGSPALKKDGTETSPRRAKDKNAKRRTNSDARKSISMDGKTESEELVDKIVEAPTRPWPRPGKSSHPSQSFNADAAPESGVRGYRDGEGSALAGRESDAEALPSVSRPGSWRHNPDGPGLLGKPGKNVEYLGRVQGRETEANVPSSRQAKHMRRGSNDPEGARRHEPMNDSDSWGKPGRDLDGPRLGNDSEVMVNRLREGRKELTRSEGGPKASSSSGGFNRQNDKKGRESPDRESGEWRESTPGIEQMDMKGMRNDQGKSRDVEPAAVSRPVPNKTQNRELRKPSPAKAAGDFSKRPSPIKSGSDFRRPSPSTATGDLRKPSPVKPVGDFRKPSPAKAAGDIRKPSPATSNAQKLAQIAQKEPQKIDQGVGNRAGTGSGKPLSSNQVEERPEGGSSRNGRASNDTFERPMESRGVKRQLDEGSSEPPRVYKKPSIAPVAPSSSLNRDSGAARPTEKKQVSPDLGFKPQNSESGRGGSLETPGNLAGPSGKAPSGENGRKQRPLGKGQKSSSKEGMEPPKGRDWKAKNGAGLLGPGGDRRKDSLQSDPGLSNGKRLKSSSSPEEVSGKEYFAKYEKDSPDLRGPIRSYEEAEAYRKEYQTKYPVYSRLYTDLDRNGGHFNVFKRELLLATSFSDKQQISTKVRREFHAIRKEFKRMQKTFDILHEELQTIKQHLRNFAGKAGQG